jgi:hypothetical protein
VPCFVSVLSVTLKIARPSSISRRPNIERGVRPRHGMQTGSHFTVALSLDTHADDKLISYQLGWIYNISQTRNLAECWNSCAVVTQ